MSPITLGGIPGITSPASSPCEPPTILIVAREKFGKSRLAVTLMDWPVQGKGPLVLAFDRTGPDSCQQHLQAIGRDMAVIKVEDQMGTDIWTKTRTVLTNLEQGFRNVHQPDFPFSSIVVDCGSTMAALFYEGSRTASPNRRDNRQTYGDVKNWACETYWRLSRLHVPVIWLAWLKEPETVTEGDGPQKRVRLIEGGADVTGNFRNFIAGKATQILILNKTKVGQGAPGADQDGYAREFHTRSWANINGGGRFQWKLPEPCPPHLGYVISALMAPAQPQIVQP